MLYRIVYVDIPSVLLTVYVKWHVEISHITVHHMQVKILISYVHVQCNHFTDKIWNLSINKNQHLNLKISLLRFSMWQRY